MLNNGLRICIKVAINDNVSDLIGSSLPLVYKCNLFWILLHLISSSSDL